ncbi:MAG: helix-turn-helix transcriptional regulator [Epulopiscium sp.]|nr:helix-turn-helix transcriptional regulator [Candidatus Epulonipiscium sp.]
MDDNILGQRLKLLRVRAGLTQTEFGQPFNLAKSTISQYESGKSRPDDELKKKIADYYKVSLDWLMGRTEDKNFPPIQHSFEKRADYQIRRDEIEFLKEFSQDIQELSEKSKEDLKRYIELLQIRDWYYKNKQK